jgi:hypothetical protein
MELRVQNPTDKHIQELLESLKHPMANNAPILAVNQRKMMQAQKGGFPHEMYHATLKPVVVVNIEQEQALALQGYTNNYTYHDYPTMLFRRNMSTVTINGETRYKFADSDAGECVEMITAQSAEDEKRILALKVPPGCSEWEDSPLDLAPLPEESAEDPQVTIARLQGELDGLKNAVAASPKKPAKE